VLEEIMPRFQVQITRQSKTKSGTVKDEISVRIHRGGYLQSYKSLSGGEKFSVDIACRLALARVVGGKDAVGRLQTLIVDEPGSAMDPKRRASLKDAFIRLQQRFSSMYIVTHLPDLEEIFGTVIEIKETPEGPAYDVIQ
jgi:DNA repair exonuclease SbcCD ATPase subunit